MKLKVTVNQTEYEIDVEVEEEAPQGLGPIVIGVNGGSNPIPTKASVSAVSSNAVARRWLARWRASSSLRVTRSRQGRCCSSSRR